MNEFEVLGKALGCGLKLERVVRICLIIIKGKKASINDALMKPKRKVTLKSPL
jgi:hypothetical protein